MALHVPGREALVDVTGLAGLLLVCAGVFLLWGPGWACITAGVPIVAAYVWREVRPPRRQKGRG